MNLKTSKTSKMVLTALLGALAYLITLVGFPIYPFPSFLEMEVSPIAGLMGTIALGPVAGVMIELIKNFIGFILKPVGAGVGQLANFTIGCAYIIPFGIIFGKLRKNSGFIIGTVVGGVIMTLFACLFNYFVLVPLYAKVMDVEVQLFVEITQKGIPAVTDFKTLILFAFAPFNLIKALLVSILSYLMYIGLKRSKAMKGLF